MTEKRFITPGEVLTACDTIIESNGINADDRIWGVPRGGWPIALTIAARVGAQITGTPSLADVIVDDIYDSGTTAKKYHVMYGDTPFAVAFDKRLEPWCGKWLVMPWEASETTDDSATDAIVRLLQYIGEDPNREGLLETPKRVLRAFRDEWCAGYGQDPAEVLKVFEDGAAGVDEMVVMRDIPVHSLCEHHLAPFWGTATVAYIPDGRIVGLSKLVRLVNVFARRLQVQERLTQEVASALMEHLKPKGVGVIIQCLHMCMEARGVRTAGVPTITSALRGAFYDDARARAEFMALRGK